MKKNCYICIPQQKKTTMRKHLLILAAMCAIAIGATAQTAKGKEENLLIRNGERTIFGVLSRPAEGKKKQPVAIIAHGFNGNHVYGKNYFEALNSIGYQCYTFDFPCGSIHNQSDTNTMNMSVKDEQSDLQAIVKHFRSQPDVDASHIVLIGESQGGLVAAMTAAENPKEISKLVLVFPALCIPDNWNARYPRLEEIPDTTRLWNVPMGRRFFAEIHDMKPYEEIGKYKKPVLIVHGDVDPIVPIDYSRRAVEVYKKATLRTIPNAGHGFKPNELQQSLEWIKEFLK